MTDLLIEGTLDRDAYQQRRDAILLRRQQLKESLEGESETWWEGVRRRFETANTASQGYISAVPEEKREILSEIGSKLSAAGKDLIFTMRFPYAQLVEWRQTLIGGPRQASVRKDGAIHCVAEIGGADRTALKAATSQNRRKELRRFLQSLPSRLTDLRAP